MGRGTLVDPRHEEQQRIVDLYNTSAPLKCCLVLSTGFGKSKVAIDILRHHNPDKVLILVNSTLLRDLNWKEEFEKFEAMDIYAKTELVTYQAAYKWKAADKDLTGYFIIADEADFAGDTDELSKFFYEYPFIRTLALTGFITDKKRDWFKNYLPILEELKASDAQDKEILNDIHFVYVKYELSDNPNDVVVEYKSNGVSKSFTQSENNAYDYQQRAVQNCMIADSINAKNYLEGKITDQEYSAEKRTTDYKLKQAITKRSNLLLNSKSTQRMARKLLEYLLEAKPTSKIIIFSKRTEQSLAICGPGNVYNGKVTKKQAAQNFVDFKSGALRHLGVCDKVNRGANIDELDLAILETFYGSDTQATQRLGRMMRLRPDQTATVYVLIPYYRREDKPKKAAVDRRVTYSIQETQQISWARKMLRSTTINSYEVWDYRTINN